MNQSDNAGCTALYQAAYKDNLEIVKALLEDADVNQANNAGHSPLYWAACNNNLEIVRELLKKGADVNRATNAGLKALNIAVELNNLEMVKDLVAYSADETVLSRIQQAQYKNAIAEGKTVIKLNTEELKSTIVHIARSLAKVAQKMAPEDQNELAKNLNGMPNVVIAQIVDYLIEAKGPHKKLKPNAICDIALDALAKLERRK